MRRWSRSRNAEQGDDLTAEILVGEGVAVEVRGEQRASAGLCSGRDREASTARSARAVDSPQAR
ncbi:hypothetical protein [Streptomyces clavuligerus]|uniref:hypothetical protein n=1 Tax=Streptomyces clavuligerus TaxID=1901 RepID=UPI001F07391F|nr:hypothetical protein [Streptomyces clavuligerus]